MSTKAPKSTTLRTVPFSSMPGCKSSSLRMPFLKIAGHHLIHAGDVAQQGDARRIQIDAHLVDARLDDAFQRLLQVARIDIMLIQPDADALRIDLNEFTEGILQAAANGDRAAQGRV